MYICKIASQKLIVCAGTDLVYSLIIGSWFVSNGGVYTDKVGFNLHEVVIELRKKAKHRGMALWMLKGYHSLVPRPRPAFCRWRAWEHG